MTTRTTRRGGARHGLWAGAALLSLGAAAAAASTPFAIADPPAWLATFELELPAPVAPASAAAATPPPAADSGTARAGDDGTGSVTWLLEAQVLVPRRGEPVRFYRTLVELRDRSALEAWSTVEIVHSPAHERLELHRLRVRREGSWSDRLRTMEHRVAQRETRLDENILSGDQSLLLLVTDLRVGDLLEASWSVIGDNAALAGKVSSEWRLAPPGVRRRRFDLWLEPGAYADTRILGEGPAATATVDARGLRHLAWDLAPPPQRAAEPYVPDDVATEPMLQLSGFRDWSEVARWGRRLYPDGGASRALEAVADPWRALPAGDRLLRALRFVQSEVRYLSLSEGVHTVRPRPPEVVLERRFGDCKDKAALLVALLSRLGLRAHPVLVSSWRGDQLLAMLPSPGVFDHAIVVAEVDGKRIFVDPTLEPQSPAGAESIWLPRYRQGLILEPSSVGLTAIPDQLSAIPAREVTARYDVAPGLRSWKVEIETRHQGQGADGFRAELAREGREAIASSYLDFYRRAEPALEGDPLEIQEATAPPAAITIERYRRTDGAPEFETLPLELAGQLPEIAEPEKRRLPIALRFPFAHQETIDLRSPGTAFTPTAGRVENRWFLFEVTSKPLPGRVETRYRLETRGDRVAAADAVEFAAAVNEVHGLLGYTITLQAPEPPRLAAALALAAGVVVFGLAAFSARRRLRELDGAPA